MDFIISWLSVAVMGLIFVSIGWHSKTFVGFHKSARLGFHFFLGLSLYLLFVRLLGALTFTASQAVMPALLLSFLSAWFWGSKHQKPGPSDESYKNIFEDVIKIWTYGPGWILIAIQLLLFMFWLRPTELDAWAHLGSMHAGRYTNITLAMVQAGEFLRFKQNYGQSLLGLLPYQMGSETLILNLHFMLSLTATFLVLAMYGFFRTFGLSPRLASQATALAALSTTSLSIFHILVFGSGSPSVFSGYTDTIVSVGSVLVLVSLIKRFLDYPEPTSQHMNNMLLTVFVIASGWTIYSPENVVISSPVLVLAIFLSGHRDAKSLSLKAAGVLAFAVLCTFSMGGMLTPASMVSKQPVTGVMTSKSEVKFEPKSHYYYVFGSSSSLWEMQPEQVKMNVPPHRGYLNALDPLGTKFHQFAVSWATMEEELIRHLRLHFFIFIFLFLAWFQFSKMKSSERLRASVEGGHTTGHQYFLIFSSLAFLGAFLGVFFFTVMDKWNMARFMIPGTTMLLLVTGWVYVTLPQDDWTKRQLIMWRVFGYALMAPVVLNVLLGIFTNLMQPNLNKRFEQLTVKSLMIDWKDSTFWD